MDLHDRSSNPNGHWSEPKPKPTRQAKPRRIVIVRWKVGHIIVKGWHFESGHVVIRRKILLKRKRRPNGRVMAQAHVSARGKFVARFRWPEKRHIALRVYQNGKSTSGIYTPPPARLVPTSSPWAKALGLPRSQPPQGRQRQIGRVALLAVAMLALSLGACGQSSNNGTGIASGYRYRRGGVEATLPSGWHAIDRHLTDKIYPQQVLAVASYPASPPIHPRSCFPRALVQMPRTGVLLMIVDYTRPGSASTSAHSPGLPPRPSSFSYGNALHGSFECAGPSYKFDWTQAGQSFQALVWLKRQWVPKQDQEQLLAILDSFQPSNASG